MLVFIMNKLLRRLILLICFVLTACSDNDIYYYEDVDLYDECGNQIYYRNPVTSFDFPDPTIIRSEDGYFYTMSTSSRYEGNMVHLPMMRSKDLINWEFLGSALSADANIGNYVTALWAPDVNYINNQYVLYVATFSGSIYTCEIIVLTSDSPDGPYIKQGVLITPQKARGIVCIDPELHICDDGKLFLYFGSGMIGCIELTSDGMSIKDGVTLNTFTFNMEGTYIYKNDQYYYIFGSRGLFYKPDYHIVTARATNLFEEFVDDRGDRLSDSGGTEIMTNSEYFWGVGHNGEVLKDDSGRYWICYHSYFKKYGDKIRPMMISRLNWNANGWPVVGDPKIINEMPYWEKK